MLESILTQLFNRKPKWRHSTPWGDGRLPVVGEIFSFQTKPYSEFSPQETLRFGAFKVIGCDERIICVAVLNGVWSKSPTIIEANAVEILSENRFNWNDEICIFGMNKGWWDSKALCDLMPLGICELSSQEREIARRIFNFEAGTRIASMEAINFSVEGEWRWEHDREAFEAEAKLSQAKNETERRAKEERFQIRLSSLTFEQLARETFFDSWHPSPPFPPAAFIEEARSMLKHACENLEAMGPKPSRPKVRAVIKRCVEWFNEADVRYGEVIETEERESIYLALEEICHAAKQKSLVEEIDQWRNW